MLNFVWLCLTHAIMHKFGACYIKNTTRTIPTITKPTTTLKKEQWEKQQQQNNLQIIGFQPHCN